MSEVWDRARRLQDELRATINMRCLSASRIEWQTIAEFAANELLDPEEWEWILRSGFGQPPSIFITRYLKYEPQGV